ncbi:MAG: HU family DNA-binding protein [bacterium]
MTKDELIENISGTTCSKKEASDCLEAILDNITKALTKGEEVKLTGFGAFSITKRKARMGRNPRTGEKIQIAATKSPKFKPGKILKEAVK